jgi:hypothetical protein
MKVHDTVREVELPLFELEESCRLGFRIRGSRPVIDRCPSRSRCGAVEPSRCLAEVLERLYRCSSSKWRSLAFHRNGSTWGVFLEFPGLEAREEQEQEDDTQRQRDCRRRLRAISDRSTSSSLQIALRRRKHCCSISPAPRSCGCCCRRVLGTMLEHVTGYGLSQRR